MINSIVNRHNRLNPFSEAQISIVRAATKLFLENGYTKTTFKIIEKESGIKVGNITYYFHSKEDLLKVLIEELMDFHAQTIEDIHKNTDDTLFAYAMEITAQIALCEHSQSAWDLYSSAYTLPQTYDHIKIWAAEKNFNLLHERLPQWTEHDFKDVEEVASGIEYAALKSVCTGRIYHTRRVCGNGCKI
ncbi:MAG: TetR/AcrR family transcriptional regulator [Oscillospiraceae bacterium]|nr:TetR/AcrR family transcriptional regulator [Oscillospiraceae bacterium]